MTRDRVDGALGALLGTFVGDALGMPFEGRPPAAVPDRIEVVDARLGRGTYTDDTEMMILLAESLLAHGSVREDRLTETFLAGCDPPAATVRAPSRCSPIGGAGYPSDRPPGPVRWPGLAR